MRKIKIENWKSKMPNGEEADENLLMVFNALIGQKKPEEMPRGLDLFRTMNRIGKAFDNADKSGFLILEENDYLFLKKTVESDVPSQWGLNKNISNAVENFMSAEALEGKNANN